MEKYNRLPKEMFNISKRRMRQLILKSPYLRIKCHNNHEGNASTLQTNSANCILTSDAEFISQDSLDLVDNYEKSDEDKLSVLSCMDEISNFEIDHDRSNFLENLRLCFIKHQLSVRAINDILENLNKYGVSVPNTKAQLFNQKTNKSSSKPLEIIIGKGKFMYLGVEYNLLKCEHRGLKRCEKIVLDVGVDGLPLFKSSRINIWPIVGVLREFPDISPFVIGVYCGPSHPSCHDLYFGSFADECCELKSNGIRISSERLLKQFSIRVFCLDTPAKSFLTCTRGHNAKNGCHKCTQIGVFINHRMVFSNVSGILRTPESFRERHDIDHHLPKFKNQLNVLEQIGLDMLKMCPLDPMHLIDLGHSKKLLTLLTENHKRDLSYMSAEIEKYALFFPDDFARKPRSLEDVPRFKATECHMFLYYYGPILLKKVFDTEKFNHFLQLFCAVRLLSHPTTAKQNSDYAQYLLNDYVKNFANFYEPSLLNYNLHNLLHIGDCVKQYGHLYNFSAYVFENFLYKLKKYIRSPSNILTQIKNRQDEIWNIELIKYQNIASQSKKVGFKNSCFMLKRGIRISVTKYVNQNNQKWFEGKRFKNCEKLFNHPFDSEKILNIVTSDGLDNSLEMFPDDGDAIKLVALPDNENWILMPLLHL